MSEWKEVKLGDCIDIIGGGTPKTNNPDYWNGSIPWLSVADSNSDDKYVFDTEILSRPETCL
ncbi:MAG: restriction endonuclease subunit S [Candidatus Cloacimonadaceae bacterium]|jgi:type I restriction enzyme S subunit|nr:restriction endonuclease subunit S [Candidatus Cloacimonadaceae bacterium]